MPVVDTDLANIIGKCGDEGICALLEAVGAVEEVLPAPMVPFVEGLTCTKVRVDQGVAQIWLTGGPVAVTYCSAEHVISAISRVMCALTKRPVTIHLEAAKDR